MEEKKKKEEGLGGGQGEGCLLGPRRETEGARCAHAERKHVWRN